MLASAIGTLLACVLRCCGEFMKVTYARSALHREFFPTHGNKSQLNTIDDALLEILRTNRVRISRCLAEANIHHFSIMYFVSYFNMQCSKSWGEGRNIWQIRIKETKRQSRVLNIVMQHLRATRTHRMQPFSAKAFCIFPSVLSLIKPTARRS